MGGLYCLTKLSWAWGGRRGLHCLPTSHCHRRKRGRHHYPQFSTDQIKLAADHSWKKRFSKVGRLTQSVLLITLCYSRVPSCCTAAVKAEGLPSLIFNLLAPNDALEAPGLEGRWQGERSLWMGQTHHTLMTSLILFEVPQRLKISCCLIGVRICFIKQNLWYNQQVSVAGVYYHNLEFKTTDLKKHFCKVKYKKNCLQKYENPTFYFTYFLCN